MSSENSPEQPMSKLAHLKHDVRKILDNADDGILTDYQTAIDRLSTCLKCKYLSKVYMCTAMGCGCLMPVKCMFKTFKCPENLWKQ